MPINVEQWKAGIFAGYARMFGGRIARATFAIRATFLISAIFITAAPIGTILTSSTQTLRDAYTAAALILWAFCISGFCAAFVRRLHDVGLRGYWAFVALILLPAAIITAGSEYNSYRWELDHTYNTADLNNIVGGLALIPPFLFAFWRGDRSENRFGPVPPPIEHALTSRFSIISTIGAAIILVPTGIYAGLFQSGVWVGRGGETPSIPMIDGNSSGSLFAKCWNIKGVGAGTGKGPLGGVYRDGYRGSVLDFVVSDNGEIDVVPAGETFSRAYRAEGFKIVSYGLDVSNGNISIGGRARFLIAAVYDGSQMADGNVNFTTFSFAKTGEIWPEWQVVMSTGMSLGAGGTNRLLNQSEQARGRLMIGDCYVQ